MATISFTKGELNDRTTNVLWCGRRVGSFTRERIGQYGHTVCVFNSEFAPGSSLYVPHFEKKTTATMKATIKARFT